MEIWTAFLLGLVGSLHCAGMCGPLAMALPAFGPRSFTYYAGRIAYNAGRLSAYALLGLSFGIIGKSVALAGFQRWASLITGIVILSTFLPEWTNRMSRPTFSTVAWVKSAFSSLLRQRTVLALYGLGVLNGFLPCGLVYVACAGALAVGGVLSGITYMLVFGLGTVPIMLGIGLAGRKLQLALRFRYQKVVPACLLLVAALLILRGLALGIPYLSPDLLTTGGCHRCH